MNESNPENPLRQDRRENCIFRASTASDETVIRQILRETNLSLHGFYPSGSLASPKVGSTWISLCELAGEIVAVLQWRDLGEEAEVLDLAVPAIHRRKGYARLLLTNFLQEARERGTREVFLEVRESNGAALSLYRQFGFASSGRRKNYYRHPTEEALLLHLKLTG
jgi:ribosomal protein S18 acetylase RimI-like enzyme